MNTSATHIVKRLPLCTLLLCLVLLCNASRTVAQIHSRGQRVIEVGGGILDKLSLAREDNSGRWIRLSVGKYGRHEGLWQMGLLAQVKYYSLPDSSLSAVEQYVAEGTFSPALVRSSDHSWYLSPTLGLLVGYESVDDQRVDPSGQSTLSSFLWGGTAGLTAEWNITQQVALLGYARGNYLASSQIQPFHFLYGIGLRINYFSK